MWLCGFISASLSEEVKPGQAGWLLPFCTFSILQQFQLICQEGTGFVCNYIPRCLVHISYQVDGGKPIDCHGQGEAVVEDRCWYVGKSWECTSWDQKSWEVGINRVCCSQNFILNGGDLIRALAGWHNGVEDWRSSQKCVTERSATGVSCAAVLLPTQLSCRSIISNWRQCWIASVIGGLCA